MGQRVKPSSVPSGSLVRTGFRLNGISLPQAHASSLARAPCLSDTAWSTLQCDTAKGEDHGWSLTSPPSRTCGLCEYLRNASDFSAVDLLVCAFRAAPSNETLPETRQAEHSASINIVTDMLLLVEGLTVASTVGSTFRHRP